MKKLRSNPGLDQQVCEEVLSGKTYPPVQVTGEIKVIADVGANVGAASVLFRERYPTARIVAFEPDTKCMPFFAENMPNTDLFPYALGQLEFASVPLFLGTEGSVCNSLEPNALTGEEKYINGMSVPGGNDHRVFVALHAAAKILPAHIDLLKIDTEGSELPILRSLGPERLSRIAIIYLEFHNANDRLEIEYLLRESHLLFRADVTDYHRGNLCFVNRERIPVEAHWARIG